MSNQTPPVNLHNLVLEEGRMGGSEAMARIRRVLYGISTCAMLLSIDESSDVELGAFMRGGLSYAIDELTGVATNELEALDKRLLKQGHIT